MEPIWGRQDPGGPHVGPMNVVIWDLFVQVATDGIVLFDHIMKTHVRGFFDTDLHEVSWHFATHEAVRPSGF